MFIVDPYVRVLMLNGKTGKKIKKRKTKFLRAVMQPEFNETLTFDLPITQLDMVQFLIVLCNKVKITYKRFLSIIPKINREIYLLFMCACICIYLYHINYLSKKLGDRFKTCKFCRFLRDCISIVEYHQTIF